jgi:hypothetical protein
VERILPRAWVVLGGSMLILAILAYGVSLAGAQEDSDEGPPDGPPQYADELESGVVGPEGAEGPQCSPEWLREWYLWEDPEGEEEDWWYYWWYKWCQNPDGGDWFKAYESWEWWGPAGDEEVDEFIEEWAG